MKVAKIYPGRDEIVTRLSWDCLVRLASTSISAAARAEIEARVIAGEKIVASDIVRAHEENLDRTAQAPGRSTGAAHAGSTGLRVHGRASRSKARSAGTAAANEIQFNGVGGLRIDIGFVRISFRTISSTR